MNKINHLIRPSIQALKAYDAEDDFSGIKLDAMESPWSAIEFNEQLFAELQHTPINLYPDSQQKILRHAVANYFDVEPCKLLFGNGSDELITLLIMSIGQANDTILSLNPSFAVYHIQTIANQRQYISVDLNDDFSLNIDKTLQQIEKHQPKIIFIAYPNNPTGNCFEREDIKTIIKQAPGLVILDEAYYAFAPNAGFLSDVNEYDNLLVMRTFSKLGFAGLRVGVLVGHEQWLKQINKVRLPYNINTLSQYLLANTLKNPSQFETRAELICQQREKLITEISQLALSTSIKVYPSDANFILFKVNATNSIEQHQLATQIHHELKDRGILIRCLSKPDGLLAGCLRVSIGTPEQNTLFLQQLKNCLC